MGNGRLIFLIWSFKVCLTEFFLCFTIIYVWICFQKMAEKHPRYNRFARQRYTGGRPVFVSSQTTNINGRIIGIPPPNTPGFGLMPPPKVGSKAFGFAVNRPGGVDNGGSVFQVHKKGVMGGLPKSVVVDSGMSFPRNTILRSPTYQDYVSQRTNTRSQSVNICDKNLGAKAHASYVRDQEYTSEHINHVPVDIGSHDVGLSPNSFFDVQADKAAELAIAQEFGK